MSLVVYRYSPYFNKELEIKIRAPYFINGFIIRCGLVGNSLAICITNILSLVDFLIQINKAQFEIQLEAQEKEIQIKEKNNLFQKLKDQPINITKSFKKKLKKYHDLKLKTEILELPFYFEDFYLFDGSNKDYFDFYKANKPESRIEDYKQLIALIKHKENTINRKYSNREKMELCQLEFYLKRHPNNFSRMPASMQNNLLHALTDLISEVVQ